MCRCAAKPVGTFHFLAREAYVMVRAKYATAGEPVTGRVTNRLSHLRSADASIIRMALAAPRLSAYIHVDAK